MSDPATLDEYQQRSLAGIRFEQHGHYVLVHCPCPFCGAPDFNVYPLADTERAIQLDCTCKECARSSKAVLTRTRDDVSFEFVQTGGADPPAYLPKMRRLA
jgi:hypothetical protein